jgi:hypothetical protein
MKRTWIKLYVDQTLRGSMIEELSPDQRWMFVGLLLMAGDSSVPGLIFKRKDENGIYIGYSTAALADTLGVGELELSTGLERMVEKDKVTVNAQGVIAIVNWTKYQSEYERTRHAPSRVVQKYGVEGEGDVDREVDVEKKDVHFDHPSRSWKNITDEDKTAWAEAYPACDVAIELARMREWILGAGARGQKRAWRAFIVKWLKSTQAEGGTRNVRKGEYKVSQVGTNTGPKKSAEYWAEVRLLDEAGINGDAFDKAMVEFEKKEK